MKILQKTILFSNGIILEEFIYQEFQREPLLSHAVEGTYFEVIQTLEKELIDFRICQDTK